MLPFQLSQYDWQGRVESQAVLRSAGLFVPKACWPERVVLLQASSVRSVLSRILRLELTETSI